VYDTVEFVEFSANIPQSTELRTRRMSDGMEEKKQKDGNRHLRNKLTATQKCWYFQFWIVQCAFVQFQRPSRMTTEKPLSHATCMSINTKKIVKKVLDVTVNKRSRQKNVWYRIYDSRFWTRTALSKTVCVMEWRIYEYRI